MTTNIDGLIARLESVDATSAYTSSEAAEALRSQQKLNEELESDLKQTREIVMQEAKLANEAEAKLSAIRQAVESKTTHDKMKVLTVLHILNTVKDAPAKQPYNKRKIAEELIATAQGDSYYGNALYVALDLAEGKDKEMLHRYLHGSELTSDKFALQEFANRLAQQPEQGE